MNTNIEYTQAPDGMLYPNLTATESGRPLGKYGLTLCKHLRRHRPVLYNQMLADGTLTEFLARRDTQAYEMLEELESQLRAKNPPPKTRDFWENIRYNQSIRDQAEEAVLLSLMEVEN